MHVCWTSSRVDESSVTAASFYRSVHEMPGTCLSPSCESTQSFTPVLQVRKPRQKVLPDFGYLKGDLRPPMGLLLSKPPPVTQGATRGIGRIVRAPLLPGFVVPQLPSSICPPSHPHPSLVPAFVPLLRVTSLAENVFSPFSADLSHLGT